MTTTETTTDDGLNWPPPHHARFAYRQSPGGGERTIVLARQSSRQQCRWSYEGPPERAGGKSFVIGEAGWESMRPRLRRLCNRTGCASRTSRGVGGWCPDHAPPFVEHHEGGGSVTRDEWTDLDPVRLDAAADDQRTQPYSLPAWPPQVGDRFIWTARWLHDGQPVTIVDAKPTRFVSFVYEGSGMRCHLSRKLWEDGEPAFVGEIGVGYKFVSNNGIRYRVVEVSGSQLRCHSDEDVWFSLDDVKGFQPLPRDADINGTEHTPPKTDPPTAEQQLAVWLGCRPEEACESAWERLGQYALSDGMAAWSDSSVRNRARMWWDVITADKPHMKPHVQAGVDLYERACIEAGQWWKGRRHG